jgi:hypothetical protein
MSTATATLPKMPKPADHSRFVLFSPTKGTWTTEGKWSSDVNIDSKTTRFPTYHFTDAESQLLALKVEDARARECNPKVGEFVATTEDLALHGIPIHV